MKVDVYSDKGTKLQNKVELPKGIFGIEPHDEALRQYVRVYRVNQRQGTVSKKTRGEVRGGGKKPWRQKGTGRARHGSIRSPIWVGGGIVHGPKPRDFEASLPKKVKDLALRSALSYKAKEGKVKVLSKFSPKEPKTSLASKLLDKLGVRKPLVITAELDDLVVRSFRNIPGSNVQTAQNLNPYEVLDAKDIILLKDGIGALEERLGGARKKTESKRKGNKSTK